jgi:hypothetical protein
LAYQFDTSSWRTIQEVLDNMATYSQQILDTTIIKQVEEMSTGINAIPTVMLRDLQDNLDHIFNLPGFRAYVGQLHSDLECEPDTHEVYNHPESDLIVPKVRERILTVSPSLAVLEKLRVGHLSLDAVTWRQFEEVIAELLRQNGYDVRLGPGSKDGGKDLIAIKYLPGCGFFMAVWQAKKLRPGKKVGISVIRELADTREEQKASKGVIVTTTALTKGALSRIERDCYQLSKVDGVDLLNWIRTGQAPDSPMTDSAT